MAARRALTELSHLSTTPKSPAKTIAVLPFANFGGGTGDDYFCDGMTEEIINALAHIDGLRVTSRTSSFHFKGKNLPIREIGEALGVSTILEGSIRLSGERMRLTAQLIDVAEDFHFFSETFDRSVADIFAVQDEISLLIADRLREYLGHMAYSDQLVKQRELSVTSYKDYLNARYRILKMTEQDIAAGIEIAQMVIERHPDFPLAYLSAHLGYTMLATLGFAPAMEAFAKGGEFLQKAIELDPDLPECQLQLSYGAFLQDWDLPRAYTHLNNARRVRPTTEFYQSMASMLVAEGKFKAAMNYIRTAIQLDPLSNINYHLEGYIHYTAEEYEAAIRGFDRSLGLNAGFMPTHLYRGQALLLSGRAEEALAFYRDLPEEADALVRQGAIALAHAVRGHAAEAAEGMAVLTAALETEMEERALNLLVLCQAVSGDHEAAIATIKKAASYRFPMLVYFFVDPLLKPLRAFPFFTDLQQQVLGSPSTIPTSEGKYKQQLIAPEAVRPHKERLQQLMRDEAPYLDPELSLRDLARMMDLPPNHLSQLLNAGFEQNFAEFVNGYRLETFKSLIRDPANGHLTILALALESGFNSKTAFNTYFKKATGMTPNEFKKQSAGQ